MRGQRLPLNWDRSSKVSTNRGLLTQPHRETEITFRKLELRIKLMSPSVSDHRLPGGLVPGDWAAKCVPGDDARLMSSSHIYHLMTLTWLAWPRCSLAEGWLGLGLEVGAGLSHDPDPDLDEERGMWSAGDACCRGQGRSCTPATCPQRWGWRW